MRITGGLHHGRRILSPEGQATRPTSDRARQAIFNILHHAKWQHGILEEAEVLDVFAGTGALGLEALSQGGRHAVFMEQDRAAAALCRKNVEEMKEKERSLVLCCDALKPPSRPVDVAPRTLVFLDPPYERNMGAQALTQLSKSGWLRKGALCVLEMSKKAPETVPCGFTKVDERIYGIARVDFLMWNEEMSS